MIGLAAEDPRDLSPASPWLVFLLSAALGCGSGPPPQEANASWDSAGVRIIENLRGTWTVPWQVRPEPLLTIGSRGANPDQALDGVTGALRLPDGRVVVGNGGSLELLFFDKDGELLRKAGGRGEGPGEFQSLEWVTRYGSDSILALDVWGQRVSYFDSAGNFRRSVHLEPNAENPFPRPVGFFGNGSFLATKGIFRLGGDPPAGRAERALEPLFRISSDGGHGTLLGSFPGVERAIVPTGSAGSLERRMRPFGRVTVFAAAADRYYVADNASYEIRVFSITGRLIQIIRKRTSPLILDASDLRSFEDSTLDAVESYQRPQMRVLFANLPPPPATYPAFQPEIHVDEDLNVWIKESTRFGDPSSRWSVFSPEGELLGSLEMPPGVRILEIGGDYVLGLRRDELDVEYVQLFHLRRGR